MSDKRKETMSESSRNGVNTAYPVVIEICALVLLILASIFVDASQREEMMAVNVLFLLAAVAAILTRRVRTRAALMGMPLVFMYAYAHIDSARAAIRIPGGSSQILIPLAVSVLAVMICSFLIMLLFSGSIRSKADAPMHSMIAAAVFVLVLSGALQAINRGMNLSDGGMVRIVISSAIAHGLLFVLLSDLLARPGLAERFSRYVAVYSASAVLFAVIM